MAVVEVRRLTKRFGRVTAVDELSFDVEPGRVTGFLGPNGAGKTTTLRIMLGLVRPTEGSALIGGVAYRDLRHPARVVGAVLEASGFHPSRSARDHLGVVATTAGISRKRVDEVLAMVGLSDVAGRAVGGFSLGMRQRLELATALLGDPELLVLDEPANGLDPQGISWLRGLLRWLSSQGRAVLVSSHLLAEAAQTVDDVVIVAGGRLAASGPLAELTGRVVGSVRIRTPEAQRLQGVLAGAGITAHYESHDVLVADGATPEVVGPLVAAQGVVVYEMTSSGGSLEDVFLALTASGPGASGPGASGPGASGPGASAVPGGGSEMVR